MDKETENLLTKIEDEIKDISKKLEESLDNEDYYQSYKCIDHLDSLAGVLKYKVKYNKGD